MNNVSACVINGTGSTSALDAVRGCVRPQSGADVKRDTHLAPESYGKRKWVGITRWWFAAEEEYSGRDLSMTYVI